MPSVYPAVAVNFKLRFDEALTILETPTPQTVNERVAAPPLTGAVGGFLGLGQGTLLSQFAGAINGALQSNTAPTTQPLVTRRGDKNATFIMNRVPKHMSVELPGYRQAGTFELVIDFKELPIDPRAIRSAAVEVHIGAVSPADFAEGMSGAKDPNTGRPLSVLRTREASGIPRADTLIMVGLVDKWKAKHGDDGSNVTISGRDLRSALIDMKLGTNPSLLRSMLDQLDTSKPIDNVVQQILSYHPAHDLFTIETNPFEWPDKVLPAPLGLEHVPRIRKGAKGKKKGGSAALPGGHADMSFWDLITQFCYLVGAIPYFEGYGLRIRPSRAIFDQQRAGFDPNSPTPFAGGLTRDVNGERLSFRRLVYGRDTVDLEFERDFTGSSRPKTIRCVSTDPTGKTKGGDTKIEARWPPHHPGNPKNTAARTQNVSPSNQQAHEEIKDIPVPGIHDEKRLREMAKALFEEIGRNEMGGSCSTVKLGSFGDNGKDPDLLRLRPGDGVEFLVDVQPLSSKAPVVSTLTDTERVPFDQAVENIREKVKDINLARVIVATARGLVFELQRFFRVANAKYDWDTGSGVTIAFDFQNYFVVRYDVLEKVSPDPGVVKKVTVPKHTGGPQ